MDVVVKGAAHRNINCTVFNISVRCSSTKKIIVHYKCFASPPAKAKRRAGLTLSCTTNPFYKMVIANA